MSLGDFRYELAKALLWGSQIGWVDPVPLMSEQAAKEARFMKTLMDFRRTLHDVVYGGLFIRELTPTGDNPVVKIPGFGDDASVLAAEWRKPDGRKVYIVVNMDENKHKVSLPGVDKPFEMAGASCKRIDL